MEPMPGLPKLSARGLALACAISSRKLCTGRLAVTTSTYAPAVSCTTGSKALLLSYPHEVGVAFAKELLDAGNNEVFVAGGRVCHRRECIHVRVRAVPNHLDKLNRLCRILGDYLIGINKIKQTQNITVEKLIQSASDDDYIITDKITNIEIDNFSKFTRYDKSLKG